MGRIAASQPDAQAAAQYLHRLTERAGHACRVIDKMPENFLHLGVIARLFPQARVIHCRRDPLDTCLSCYFQNFPGNDFASSLEDLGTYYLEYERLMAHWRTVLPLRMLEVRYEELVINLEARARDLVAFCGLEWSDHCLRFYEQPLAVQTASALQVRQPIYTNSVGRWRHYASHLQSLRTHLATTKGTKSTKKN
jgi:hypothetical protein